MATEAFELARFVDALEGTYALALAEVRRGKKRTHWMWFIYPQLAGLVHSEMAKRYAIHSIDEAKAYLDHPVLGPRYREVVAALQDLHEADAELAFGPIDAQKLRSSLTLFSIASGETLFTAALERWFGALDPATLALLR